MLFGVEILYRLEIQQGVCGLLVIGLISLRHLCESRGSPLSEHIRQ